MAMTDDRSAAVRYEDVVGLKSRISWSAVFAGSVVALAVYLVFALFFGAIGLSLTDTNVQADTIGWGGLIAAVLSMAIALFVGGCVTTQLTAGETRAEAVVHGVLTWAVVSFLSLWLVAAGVRAGSNALVGAAVTADATAQRTGGWEELARRAGVTQQQIDQWRATAQTGPDAARAAANEPANRDAVRNTAITTAWVTFFGTLVAMAACIGGAVFGSGPRFRFVPVSVRATAVRQETINT